MHQRHKRAERYRNHLDHIFSINDPVFHNERIPLVWPEIVDRDQPPKEGPWFSSRVPYILLSADNFRLMNLPLKISNPARRVGDWTDLIRDIHHQVLIALLPVAVLKGEKLCLWKKRQKERGERERERERLVRQWRQPCRDIRIDIYARAL